MPVNMLRSQIEDVLLEFAPLYNDVTTSDLQGIAMVKSKEILDLVKAEIDACGLKKPGNHLNAVQCLWEKGLI